MHLNYHLPSYFTKKVREEIGELYASSVISNLAQSITALFEPIFLYNVLHFTVPQVLLFFAVVYITYLPTIILGGKFASAYGYKHSIAMSVPFQVLYWVLLLLGRESPGLAYTAAIALGLQKALFWPGFHALMARYADQQQLGREFSVVYAIEMISQIIGPFIGGFLAQRFSMTATFVIAAIVYSFSVMPLFTKQELFVPKNYHYGDTWNLFKAIPKKFVGYMGFGEELIMLTIWPVFIYIVVKNYEGTGILATMASLIAAVMAVIIGKITDQYTKRVLIKLGAFFSALVWFARFIASNVWNVFALDTLSRASKEMDFIPLSTVTYLRAAANHVVPYAIFFEQSLSVGKLSACLLGALLFHITGSFVVLFVLAGCYSLLYMYI